MNYATLRMMNFTTRLCDCRTTSSIHYCRHRLLHHNITICENAHIHCSYLNILLTCQIVISSHTCCIKTLTRPIIPVLYHWTGLEILFYCDIVFVYLHYPVVRPEFWHALNKRILIDWLRAGDQLYNIDRLLWCCRIGVGASELQKNCVLIV